MYGNEKTTTRLAFLFLSISSHSLLLGVTFIQPITWCYLSCIPLLQWWWHFHSPLTQIQSAFQQSHDADCAEILKYFSSVNTATILPSWSLMIQAKKNICAIGYLFSLTDLFFCDFLDHKTLGSYLLNLVSLDLDNVTIKFHIL